MTDIQNLRLQLREAIRRGNKTAQIAIRSELDRLTSTVKETR